MNVPTLDFPSARSVVVSQISSQLPAGASCLAPLHEAAGRVLARDAIADRDYPPVDRSLRDGFALRAEDLPGPLRVTGEVRAGEVFADRVGPGEAVEIMTGAPVPAGANAVLMVEHATREGDSIRATRDLAPGAFINPQGSEIRAGAVAVPCGALLGFAEIAMLATAGYAEAPVHPKPRVAILATGDEIVEVAETPAPHQIRNSNACALAVQVTRAGGVASILPVARDNLESTKMLIEQGLTYDLLLLSGGVSAGKYDFVEDALASFGAEFFFDRVLIQPGQPLVFGRARDKFFFGLPGNPASTMVCFEVFARAAVEILAGRSCSPLALVAAKLTGEFRHKTGLTRFLPAHLNEGATVTPVPWSGSSDVAALARANCFLVADPDRESWQPGDWINVLLR